MRKVLNFFHLKNMSNTIIHKQQPERVLLKRTIKKGALQNFATYTQESTCPGLFFNETYLKRWLRYRCFPVNIAEFLNFFYRTPLDDCFWLYLFYQEGNSARLCRRSANFEYFIIRAPKIKVSHEINSRFI